MQSEVVINALGRVLAPRVKFFSEPIARNVERGLGPLFCAVSHGFKTNVPRKIGNTSLVKKKTSLLGNTKSFVFT